MAATAPSADLPCRTVSLRGELDLRVGAALRSRLAGTPGERHLYRVIVDLTQVTFMDSSPLHVLEHAQDRCADHGGWLRLVYTHRTIALLLRAADAAGRFPRYATIADARSGRTAPRTALNPQSLAAALSRRTPGSPRP
ncbi:STAS domain-containing protein [Streptacidiphilus sp. PAMC 29251]